MMARTKPVTMVPVMESSGFMLFPSCVVIVNILILSILLWYFNFTTPGGRINS